MHGLLRTLKPNNLKPKNLKNRETEKKYKNVGFSSVMGKEMKKRCHLRRDWKTTIEGAEVT